MKRGLTIVLTLAVGYIGAFGVAFLLGRLWAPLQAPSFAAFWQSWVFLGYVHSSGGHSGAPQLLFTPAYPLSRVPRPVRVALALVFAALSSFAVGFSFDIASSTAAGLLTFANALLPISNWSWIAVALFAVSEIMGVGPIISLPYLLHGLLVLAVAFTNPRHFVPAAALLVAALIIFAFFRKSRRLAEIA